MFSPWWSAYGLTSDPMTNSPVAPDSPELLVQTAPIVELSHYLSAGSRHGGIYLVTGRYGAGKTTVLNAVPHLCAEPSQFSYFDVSVHRTPNLLDQLFKQAVIPQVERTIKSGKRALIGLDQLHNLDTQVAVDFFRSRQSDFEKLKAKGVILVFAGDERFRSLVRGAGPLGAIFDGEFPIPPFEGELGRQLLSRRMESVVVPNTTYHFPFRDEAIAALISSSAGNPRALIERARTVLREVSRRSPPISVSASDVRYATAEVTDDALAKIRRELRSPALNNALAKIGRLAGRPRGREVLHDMGRIFDSALETPALALEEVADKVRDLGIRPEVVIEAAIEAGLAESERSQSHQKLGGGQVRRTRLTARTSAALSLINRETGLVPSQYLGKLSDEVTLSGQGVRRDPLATALTQSLAYLSDERARNFVSRGIEAYTLSLDEKTASPETVLAMVRNVTRGFAFDILGDSTGNLRELFRRILAVRPPGIHPSIDILEPKFDRWEELRARYEDRGEIWSSAELSDARENGSIILRQLSQVLVERRLSGKPESEPVSEESRVGRAIEEFSADVKRWFDNQDLPDHPTPQDLARKLPALLNSLTTGKPDFSRIAFGFVSHSLTHLDQLVYVRGIENRPAYLQGQLAGVLQLLTERDAIDEARLNAAVKQGAALFAHVSEQGRPIVDPKTTAARLGTFTRELLLTPKGRSDHAEAQAFDINVAQKALLQEKVHSLIQWYSTVIDPNLVSDASVVLWYFLRNATHHAMGQLQLLPYRAHLARSLVISLSASLRKTMSQLSPDFAGVVVVKKRVSRGLYLLETRMGEQYGVSSTELPAPDLALAATDIDPTGFDSVVWNVSKPVDVADIANASASMVAQLPTAAGLGISWFKQRSNYLEDRDIELFKGSLEGPDGIPSAACVVDGRDAFGILKTLGEKESGEDWVRHLGLSGALFLGGATMKGRASPEIIPFLSFENPQDLRRVAERLGLHVSGRFLPASERARLGTP
jgi:energy-coupling factor transporter ATP-binding protein EcfA2